MARKKRRAHVHEHAFAELRPLEREGLTLQSRRNMLKASLAGIGGLSVSELLRQRAEAAKAGRPISHKSVILLWMTGGPSQLELFERSQSGESEGRHVVRLTDGHQVRGTWHEIVRQMRDQAGFSHETIAHYMRRLAERWHEQSGVEIPFADPESFLRAAVEAGLVRLEVESEE